MVQRALAHIDFATKLKLEAATLDADDGRNVPTFRKPRETPATANLQLDYVFASKGFHERVRARALNGVDEWGPSDHCRLVIEVA